MEFMKEKVDLKREKALGRAVIYMDLMKGKVGLKREKALGQVVIYMEYEGKGWS